MEYVLQEQWTEKQKTDLNNLEKKYQKNLDKLGDGHTAAIKVALQCLQLMLRKI